MAKSSSVVLDGACVVCRAAADIDCRQRPGA